MLDPASSMRDRLQMDVLTDLLARSRARGAAFAHSTIHGPWGLAFPTGPGLAVHAVVDGEVHLWTGPSEEPTSASTVLALGPGDIVLVRGDVEHRMGRTPGARCRPMDDVVSAGPLPGSARRFGSGEPDGRAPAVFFCGAYLFDGDLCAGLVQALPETVHLRPASGSALRTTMDLLAREMQRDDPGQQTVLDRLLDVALVQVLREHFTVRDDDAPTWFRASGDPTIGPALRALHADPAHPWTVADLAAEARLSRAAFSRRFSAVLGAAPLTYLTDWRMALARELLRDTDDGLAAIAGAVGYSSEFSFAAAFKRHQGVAPGRWRAEAGARAGTGLASATG
jgi:AraC-like DNA-binding protein